MTYFNEISSHLNLQVNETYTLIVTLEQIARRYHTSTEVIIDKAFFSDEFAAKLVEIVRRGGI